MDLGDLLSDTTSCLDCGRPCVGDSGPGIAPYAITRNGHRVCRACAADRDREGMIETGRATLYLTRQEPGKGWEVSNFPGTLTFPARCVRKGRHNFTTRFDAWFAGPDGYLWHGVNLGDNDLLRARRTKQRA